MIKKKIITTCCVCGIKTNGKTKIFDVKYIRPLEHESCVCHDCFWLWVGEKHKELEERIKHKLGGKEK